VPGLGASFGRGAATNFQQDMANSDCILFMGSNMAEAHPVGFRWPMKARERGATLIHVDPHYSRTSAHCDLYVPIRAGSDIAFLGGLINHVLTQERWFKEYVLAYTNASTLIQEGFRDAEDLDGLFSGYDPETQTYDSEEGRWAYEGSRSDRRADGQATDVRSDTRAPGFRRGGRRGSTAMRSWAGRPRTPRRAGG
jgi:formate dehydrogenase major subunit